MCLLFISFFFSGYKSVDNGSIIATTSVVLKFMKKHVSSQGNVNKKEVLSFKICNLGS